MGRRRGGAALDTISVLRLIRRAGWHEGHPWLLQRRNFKSIVDVEVSVATFPMTLGKGRQPPCGPLYVCRDKDRGRTASPGRYDASKRQGSWP